MEETNAKRSPNRVVDLVNLKEEGENVTCRTAFEVVPVDFRHRENPFKAHVFMCYFRGEVSGRCYAFRKCYARGCSHNLCPHVSQAVMIANRYLQRDYRILRNAGIEMEERLFTLRDMLVKFEGDNEKHGPIQTIDDYVGIARKGNEVKLEITPEYVPAVESFANYTSAQTFLTVKFVVTCLGKSSEIQRCLACYASEKEKDKRDLMVGIANARLEDLYRDFDQASIRYEKRFFS